MSTLLFTSPDGLRERIAESLASLSARPLTAEDTNVFLVLLEEVEAAALAGAIEIAGEVEQELADDNHLTQSHGAAAVARAIKKAQEL